MRKTEKGTRKFSKSEKLSILNEAKLNGVKVTLAKYGLYPATFYYWKKRVSQHGEEGLNHQTHKALISEKKRLEKENERLKYLLSQKELENALKDEMIKMNTQRDV